MTSAPYRVGPGEIRSLIGKTFEVPSEVYQRPLRFHIDPSEEGTPRGPKCGEEAYGMFVVCDHPDRPKPSFLKIFRVDAPGRRERTEFLMQLRLHDKHWMLQGFPYGALPMFDIEGVKVLGHLAFQVQDFSRKVAPSLEQKIGDGWRLAEDRRRRLAGQLCCTVQVLESLGLVHGDLSLGNVLIGWDHESGGGEVAVLCDYDGFYHPSQPLLPLKHEGKPVRRCGSRGFFYPELLEQVTMGDPNVYVETDRMALGALVCQIMLFQPDTAERLGRYELLCDSEIRSRSLSGLPSDIWAAWPEGNELLQACLGAGSVEAMPSPRQWLERLGGPPVLPPLLVLRHRRRPEWKQYVRLESFSGCLEDVDPDLRLVSVERLADGFRLSFGGSSTAPLMLRRGLSDMPRKVDSNEVTIAVGGRVIRESWDFECTRDEHSN